MNEGRWVLALETQCVVCGGKGFIRSPTGGNPSCDWCKGEGTVVTQFGKDVLAFVSKYLVLNVEWR